MPVGQDPGLDEVVEHFTLDEDELGLLRNKSGGTRLGFAVQLKSLCRRGRFPKGRPEIPDDALAHVGRQVGVPASDITFYGLSSRAAKGHRSEIRKATGWHECTAEDASEATAYLTGQLWREERREEHVRAALVRHVRENSTELPATGRRLGTRVRGLVVAAEKEGGRRDDRVPGNAPTRA